jgi:rRNA pseudouridine-1189 N-methylase Emg1 (Nep1/Mra1 family)
MLSLISFNACMKCPYKYNRTSGVIVSVLDTSAVDRGFEPGSGKTKD